MTASIARFVEGKKFMWDGRVYPSREEAEKARAAYEGDGFETSACEDEERFLVYTRRVVKQVIDGKSH